ncbi:MAG: hypothetical protein IJ805_00465 [Lachnospiraceae bacterium]|nr:hypothetical protein [Lachnospiraceae bacterium]
MGFLSDLGSSISNLGGSFKDNFKQDSLAMLGNVEKAVIEVMDLRDRKLKDGDLKPVEGPALMDDAADSISEGTMANKGGLVDYAKDITGGDKNKAISALDMAKLESAKKKLFYVQFNPGSLSLSGHSGGLVQKIDYKKGGGGVSYAPGDTNITLSVSLLFDSCDPADAFMTDKISASPTTLGTGVAKAVMSAKGKKKRSVQPEVEGFIAALRNRYTRFVTFHWGEFTYSGVLRSVGAQYTMFNVLGEPVRATVNLSMMCADSEVSPNSLAWWQQKYIDSFGGDKMLDTSGSESFVKTSQKVGNLINI